MVGKGTKEGAEEKVTVTTPLGNYFVFSFCLSLYSLLFFYLLCMLVCKYMHLCLSIYRVSFKYGVLLKILKYILGSGVVFNLLSKSLHQ